MDMLATMERLTLHQTELDFCKTKTETLILRLKINWSADTSHVLVAVNNQAGQLKDIAIFTKSDVTRLFWQGFSRADTYAIQVYGLKEESVTGQETEPHQELCLYSINAVQKMMITPSRLDQTQTILVDLRGTIDKDHMLDSLGSQDDFEVGVSHNSPTAISLKPKFPHGTTSALYIIYNERLKKEYLITSVAKRSSVFFCDSISLLLICHSRTIYKVRAIALKYTFEYSFGRPSAVCHHHFPCGKSKILNVKTRMSKEDLQKLMDKAESYCRSNSRHPGTYTITQFYRNKPRRYYEDIFQNRSGLMEKYIKDNNGDLYSPINNQINGLFFSASLDTRTMRPPPFSYFGELRLFIPAQEIFTDDTRMYFTDFFCHHQTHYVTVVLTKRGSDEDRFCQPRLLELDPRNNPFFTVTEERSYQSPSTFYSEDRTPSTSYSITEERSYQSPSTSYSGYPSPSTSYFGYRTPSISQSVVQKTFKMVSVNKFHVEFLYTENVDIAGLVRKYGHGQSKNDKVYFQEVEGRGESKKDGIPKRAFCRICNLDPPLIYTLSPMF